MKKTTRILGILLIAAMLLGALAMTASAAPATTTVDGATYYEIGSAEDLVWFANEVNENDQYKINGKLTANIDLSSVCSETLGSWKPISGYQGIFDGAGFEISGLYCTGQEMGGLFGRLYDANAVVKNVTVRGYVSGTRYVGGVVGYLYSTGAKVINCVNYATVSASNSSTSNDLYIGGVVGYFSGGEGSVIENCINYGDITAIPTVSGADVNIGGITGQSVTGSVIRNCANYGDVSDGDTTSVGWVNAGGIVGFTRGNVINCYNEGDLHQYGVKDSQKLGGIAGSAYDSAKIENCFNNGSISSDANAKLGAVTGELFGTINNTYWNTEKTSLNVSAYLSSGSTVNNTSGLSAAELATGVAAYNMGEAWGQEIGVDATPVLGGMKVYYTIDPATLCTATTPTYYYANSENTKRTHDANMPAEDYDNGFCTICGEYQPATDGDGDGYLEIGNAGQLYWFAAQVNGGSTSLNAELVANITVNSNVLTASGDLNGNPEDFRAWTPIGDTDATMYRGTFQGNGYVISGLYAKAYGVGFIKKGTYANVYNLGVLDSYFENTGYASGAILGSMNSNGTIENCFSNATIAGSSYISGGLVGRSAHYTIVKNCYYFGKTVGDPFVNSGGSWYDGKCSNNYYVSSVDDGFDFTTAITMEDVTSGKLAYMLGGAFGQNLDNGETVQSYPVISDAKVYYGYTTCDEAQTAPIYTNNSAASATKPEHHDFVYAASGNEITKHCGECNKLMGTATITATDSRYTGLPVTAAVSGTGDYASASFVITYTDAEGNSTTTAPTAIGSYTASFTTDGETASVSFTISKGVMSISSVPTVTYEYGDTHLDKAISGKVVIEGNESAVITGTWTWVEGTNTATFTPDAQYIDLFVALPDAVTVTHVVTPAIPTLTLTSPSPSMGPGQTIIMTVVAANPHNAELTDLPTEFKLYYRVGQSGTPVTVSGLTFTLPAETALGETVYVWVENVAVSGKYDVGTSNTVEIFVGQVDYSEQIKALDEAIKALEKSHGADVTELEEALAALEEAVSKLDENGYATDAELAAAKAELSGAISDLAEDIAALANVYATIDALNAAKQALQDAINANETDIEAKVANLTKALEDAQTALENAYKAADAALKANLEKQISEAETELTAAIEKVKSDLQAELAKAVENLEKTDKNNADALAKAIEDLTKAIEDAKKFATEEDAKLKEAMEKADAALQAAIDQVQANLEKAQKELQDAIDANETDIEAKVVALNEAIEAAKAAAAAGDAALRSELASAQASLNASISAIAGDLAAAKESLANAIASGDAALADKIAALSNALDNVSAAYKAADRSLKSSLTTMIQEAEATLQSAIDKVAADLAAAQQALNEAIASGDKALDDKIAALNTALEAAIAASSAADEALSSEMKQAVAALEKAIAQVQKNLDEAKAELVAKDDAMQAELEKLNTFVIVVCVIAGTALCGCGVLVYFVFFGKRKLI